MNKNWRSLFVSRQLPSYNSIAKINNRWRFLKYEPSLALPPIFILPFCIFCGFPTVSSQSVDPIITELFLFLSSFVAVPENSLFHGAFRSVGRLVKKPNKLNSLPFRSGSDCQFRVQT